MRSGATSLVMIISRMQNMRIEPAKSGDLSALLQLFAHLNADDPPLASDKASQIWRRLMEAEGTTVIVARAAQMLAASCTVTVVPNLTRGGRSYALVENVVTHADYRRRGLGRAVLDAAVQRAWDSDCYKVMLATGSRREETLRFYEAAGFDRGTKTFFEIKRR